MPRTPKVTPKAPISPAAAPVLPVAPAVPQIDIQIDLAKLTIGDLRVFKALQHGTADEIELIDLLGRCVVGGVDHLPLLDLSQIVQALAQALGVSSNPKN